MEVRIGEEKDESQQDNSMKVTEGMRSGWAIGKGYIWSRVDQLEYLELFVTSGYQK